MRVLFVLLLFSMSLFVTSCVTHTAYETARFRNRDYRTDRITLTEGGLTSEEIKSITATKPPSNFPVDLALIVVKDRFVKNEIEQLFVSNVIEELKKSEKIDRITPIPRFLLPYQLNFAVIQELGIRTLSEYVIVMVVDGESFFKWTKIAESKFQITSTVDFILVDARTTAILASDRLFSTVFYQENLFKVGEKEKALKEVFGEQGELLGQKLAELFDQGD